MHSIQIAFEVVLMFFVLVSLHEWGHYYFAKRAGILVREFAIGFGPKIFSFKKGETQYTLRILPIGGYVRMAGEDPEIAHVQQNQSIAIRRKEQQITHIYTDQLDKHPQAIQGRVEQADLEKALFIKLNVDGEMIEYSLHPTAVVIAKGKETQIAPINRQFSSKTVIQRAKCIFAGPFMNFVLAFALFILFVVISGVPSNVKLGDISPNSPAALAGLQTGDIVKQVNQQTIGANHDKLINLIQQSLNIKMDWIVVRDHVEKKVEVTPKTLDGSAKIGVIITYDTRKASFAEVFKGAGNNMVSITKGIVSGLAKLVTGQFKLNDIGGPVRTIQVTTQIANSGIPPMIFWSGILSLYLGIFNLLPFPALDGSRLVFLALEAVRGKPVDPNRESMVHFIGFAMIMLLMIAVTYNDIIQLIKG